MGIFNWLGIGADIAKPIDAIGNLYTTDKERLEAEAKLAEITQKPQLEQLKNNAIMLASQKLFESGWQPLIGWTSGACVALYYVPQLIVANFIWIDNCLQAHKVIPFPIQSDDILNLVYLLFGFGTYHLAKKAFIK